MHNGLDRSLTIGASKDTLAKLNAPMSHPARKLLTRVLTFSLSKFAKEFNNNKALLLDEFAKSYNPVMYEHVASTYKIDTFPGTGRAESVVKLLQTLTQDHKGDGRKIAIAFMQLDIFSNNKWLRDSGMETRQTVTVGNICDLHTITIYTWLTNRFLLTDFNEHDLNKICEMGASRMNLDTIKEHGLGIPDQTKKTIPYLFAIVRDVAIKQSVMKDRQAEEDRVNMAALARVMQYNTPNKLDFKADDLSDYMKRSEGYMSVFDNIIKK